MKMLLGLIVVLLVLGGYFGRPYIEMWRDHQPMSCIMEQVKLDLASDGSIGDELARQTNAAQCKAQALLTQAGL